MYMPIKLCKLMLTPVCSNLCRVIFAHPIDMRFVCGYYDLYGYHCQWFKATEVLLLSNEPVDEWF